MPFKFLLSPILQIRIFNFIRPVSIEFYESFIISLANILTWHNILMTIAGHNFMGQNKFYEDEIIPHYF